MFFSFMLIIFSFLSIKTTGFGDDSDVVFRRTELLRRSWLEKDFYIRNRLAHAESLQKAFRLNHVEGGTVLLSAPHALKHLREGRIKGADINTGVLALLLSEKTRNPVIYATRIATDPNYYDELPYKKALFQYLSENPQIKLVLDLHGAAAHREFAVDLGTLYGHSCPAEMINRIEAILAAAGIKPVSHNFFSAAGQNTVTKYVHEQFPQVCVVQVEINYHFRHGEGLEKIMPALMEIIQKIR
jgi:hypothetical protein